MSSLCLTDLEDLGSINNTPEKGVSGDFEKGCEFGVQPAGLKRREKGKRDTSSSLMCLQHGELGKNILK